MSDFYLLKNVKSNSLCRGGGFRVRDAPGYEEWVDLMIFDTQDDISPYGLIVSSGYKAGLIMVRLPAECLSEEGGINREWVVKNWSLWIIPECSVSAIYFSSGYESSCP